MGSIEIPKAKPHVVCLPFPSQGHINPFMRLAKLLHSHGFHITFVNTEFNHRRLLRSQGPEFVKGMADFKFETIPDGLPDSENCDANQDISVLSECLFRNGSEPVKKLLEKLNREEKEGEVSKVSCLIADSDTSFASKAAEELGIEVVQFWTASASGFLGYLQFDELVKRGIIPFKDEKFAADGTLDMTIDWVDGMKDMTLKDLPSFIRVTNLEDIMYEIVRYEALNCLKSSAIIINSFEELDNDVLNALRTKNPNIYSVGPIHMLEKNFVKKDSFKISGPSLWKNDPKCIQWLDKWSPNSVVYVNYGSITVISEQHFREFAWGLANSKQPFLWNLRPNLIMGESAILPQEFLNEVKDRAYIASWCPQDEVLAHDSIGAFLTHCGWNSTLESVSGGVPLICWPFFSDQTTNCKYACKDWGVGLQIKEDVKREEVAELVKEVIVGEKGKRMRERSKDWKEKAARATDVGGSSHESFTRFMKEVLQYNA